MDGECAARWACGCGCGCEGWCRAGVVNTLSDRPGREGHNGLLTSSSAAAVPAAVCCEGSSTSGADTLPPPPPVAVHAPCCCWGGPHWHGLVGLAGSGPCRAGSSPVPALLPPGTWLQADMAKSILCREREVAAAVLPLRSAGNVVEHKLWLLLPCPCCTRGPSMLPRLPMLRLCPMAAACAWGAAPCTPGDARPLPAPPGRLLQLLRAGMLPGSACAVVSAVSCPADAQAVLVAVPPGVYGLRLDCTTLLGLTPLPLPLARPCLSIWSWLWPWGLSGKLLAASGRAVSVWTAGAADITSSMKCTRGWDTAPATHGLFVSACVDPWSVPQGAWPSASIPWCISWC